jgi:hypothetical protein
MYSCRNCRDLALEEIRLGLLPPITRQPRARKSPGFAATCGRCGDVSAPSALNCESCGSALYLDPHTVTSVMSLAVDSPDAQATKGMGR